MPPPSEPAAAAGSARRHRVAVPGQPGTGVRVEVHHPQAPVTALFEAGLGLPLEVWHPVVERLPGIRCVLADRPGLGGSSPWPQAAGLADQVALVGDVLASASPEATRPVVLVGHSYAGLIVEAFARVHPDRVSALVLVDPSLPAVEAETTTLVERFPDVARTLACRLSRLGRLVGWMLAAGGTVGPGTGDPASGSIPAAYADPVHQQAVIGELLGIGGQAAELLELACRDPLPDVPILVVAAARRGGPLPLPRHPWVQSLSRRARELSPSAQVVRIDGAHLLMLDSPVELAQVIEGMVRLLAPRDA